MGNVVRTGEINKIQETRLAWCYTERLHRKLKRKYMWKCIALCRINERKIKGNFMQFNLNILTADYQNSWCSASQAWSCIMCVETKTDKENTHTLYIYKNFGEILVSVIRKCVHGGTGSHTLIGYSSHRVLWIKTILIGALSVTKNPWKGFFGSKWFWVEPQLF